MILNDVLEIINLISNDKIIKSTALVITLCVLLIGIFASFASAVILYTCYILGYVVAWFIIKHPSKITEGLHRLLSFYPGGASLQKTLKHSCSICDDLSCKRHQQSNSVTPWKSLQISKELNDSLEKFFNRIIENFVSSWYAKFTNDSDFLSELRYSLRFVCATVINRLLELDVASVIANKLIPCVVRHIDDYYRIRDLQKTRNVEFKEVAAEYLGKRLHVAVTRRKNELTYLQQVVSCLFGNILPESYLKCRNYTVMIREILAGWVFLPLMDVLADPNVINYIVIVAVTYKPKKAPKNNGKQETVSFLENFTTVYKNSSPFATNLNKIKNNPELLYEFMQFLKKQEHIHLLQFCLEVDDFNLKYLEPNLTQKRVEELHSVALKLYKDYLDTDSLNFVGYPVETPKQRPETLTQLTKLLYNAYDYTFNELETTWLPQYFHSNEFYGYICGSKIVPLPSKQAARNFGSPIRDRARKYEPSGQGTVSKISSGFVKIRGVLKANQPIEGSFFPIEAQNVEDDLLLAECKTLFRDLSTWKVSITSYQASPSNKVIYFSVHVEKWEVLGDESTKSLVVLRKDQDFYALKAKLVEFHGENEICDSPLPSRKAGSSIEIRMAKYEDFLRKLMRKPILRSSDLLYSFLTIQDDFSVFVATNAPNVQDFGNIYQSVAHKLRKEKGQHLDSFMTAFLNSTGKSRTEKLDWAEVGEEYDVLLEKAIESTSFPKTYINTYGDNFGVDYESLGESTGGSLNPEGFTESLFYLLKHVFRIPERLLKVYVSFCCLARQVVDFSCQLFIERKLRSGLSHSNLAFLVRLLEDVIFNPHTSPPIGELEKRKTRAFRELKQTVPLLVCKLLGPGIRNGFEMLLEILQNPHYNKQLAYNLLDIVLSEMYPNVGKT